MTNTDDLKDWHILGAQDALDLILDLAGGGRGGWTWTRNNRCKYVSIKFDMRDGAFILQDREGKRITASDLIHQNPGETDS